MPKLTKSESHVRLFDRIALPYSWFFAGQTRNYLRCFETAGSRLPLPEGRRALDIGCGTGAFTAALRARGWDASGVDASAGMAQRAARRGLPCSVANALDGLGFDGGSFDLVSAAYVAHGLPREERKKLYLEMKRLSSSLVLIHDYTADRALFTTLVEWLEGGDYFGFIETGLAEMREVFTAVDVVQVGKRAAWYLCSVD